MSIFKYPAESLPWIKESVFRDIFLPGFIECNRELNLKWIKEIAINPYARVLVVSDNNTKEVLFEVPAFLTGVKETEVDISAATNHFGRIIESGRGAKAANRYLRNAVGEGIVDPKENEDDIENWQDILSRYGYNDLKKEKVTVNDTSGLVDEEEEFG